jgi:hypothetical protein
MVAIFVTMIGSGRRDKKDSFWRKACNVNESVPRKTLGK